MFILMHIVVFSVMCSLFYFFDYVFYKNDLFISWIRKQIYFVVGYGNFKFMVSKNLHLDLNTCFLGISLIKRL